MDTERIERVGVPVTALIGNELKDLANGANAVGTAIDPSIYDAEGAFWELSFTPAAGLTAGTKIALYFLPSIDGTNYADGGAAADPAAVHKAHDDGFVVAAGTDPQRLILPLIQLPPVKFKPVLGNDSGQAFGSGTTYTLKFQPYRRVRKP